MIGTTLALHPTPATPSRCFDQSATIIQVSTTACDLHWMLWELLYAVYCFGEWLPALLAGPFLGWSDFFSLLWISGTRRYMKHFYPRMHDKLPPA
jgi:hypothetical protein